MIVAFTGHRPARIPEEIRPLLIENTKATLLNLGATLTITGMAQGFDQMAAKVSYELGIPYVAAVPYEGHIDEGEEYQTLLERAAEIVIVSAGKYTSNVYWKRDKYMVDRADEVIAAWDRGRYGGTWITVKYAWEQQKPVHILMGFGD